MPHPEFASQKASLLLIHWGVKTEIAANHQPNVPVMQSLAPQDRWRNALMHSCCQAHLILLKNKHISCYPTTISGGNCSAWSHCSTKHMLCKESIRKAVTHFGQPKKKQACPRQINLETVECLYAPSYNLILTSRLLKHILINNDDKQ